ncbi:MAG TPA: SMP-30/gluconolactonase/LRE family protein [Candidatus Acidoferrales bacterium]|nr:SMP-30/gluconolactonase/LRE family protein [Candidatus Acidoferrales bacterium]
MRKKTVFVIVACICGLALFLAEASPAAAQAPTCMPSAEQAAQLFNPRAGGPAGQRPAPAAQPVPRNVTITAIAGVVAEGGEWAKVWQEGGNSADGIIRDRDGSVLVAQEDYDSVLKINADGHTSVAVADAKGVGSLSMDRLGRLYGVHRTERPGSTKPDKASIVNAVTELAPKRMMLTDKWADGSALTVRPNDLAADSHGGAYFTTGCLYYASPKGVTVMADNIRTNGIAFSPDDKILYVTNGGQIVAFNVDGPGKLTSRRDFAMLPAGSYGDGMAIDTEGRLYVSSGAGVQVFDKSGKYLGVIPTPRGIISVAFAGPDKKTLYVVGSGAEDKNGAPIREGPQQTAATVYRLPVIAQGLKDRAK